MALPTAAEAFVEGNQLGRNRLVAAGQLVLAGEEVSLGVEHLEQIDGARLVLLLRQRYRTLVFPDRLFHGLPTRELPGVPADRGLGFLQRIEDDLLVLDDGLSLTRLHEPHVAGDASGVEDIPSDRGAYAKLPAVPIADPRDLGGVHDEGSGETHARVEVRRCDADAGGGGGKRPFGPSDVWPPPEEIGGQANRYGCGRNRDRLRDDKLVVQNARLLS